MTHNKYHGSGRLYSEMELDERAEALDRLHPPRSQRAPRITPGILDKLLMRARKWFHRVSV